MVNIRPSHEGGVLDPDNSGGSLKLEKNCLRRTRRRDGYITGTFGLFSVKLHRLHWKADHKQCFFP